LDKQFPKVTVVIHALAKIMDKWSAPTMPSLAIATTMEEV